MRYENVPFNEAIEKIAQIEGLTVEYKKLNPDEQREYDKRLTIFTTLEKAVDIYSRLNVKVDWKQIRDFAEQRKIPFDLLRDYGVFYSGTNNRLLTDYFIENFWTEALKSGIVTDKDKNKDFFYNRIMFPIHDALGNLCSFTGRSLKQSSKTKYLHTTSTIAFDKSKILYGLYQAKSEIRKTGCAYLVEGPTDVLVLVLVAAGLKNVVDKMGSALTHKQAKLLKGYCNKVILFYDGDKINQYSKHLPLLLKIGFEVDLIELPKELDPDDFRLKYAEGTLNQLKDIQYDAVIWVCSNILNDAKNPTQKSMAIKEVTQILDAISNLVTKNEYKKIISREFEIDINDLQGNKIGDREFQTDKVPHTDKSLFDWQLADFDKYRIFIILDGPLCGFFNRTSHKDSDGNLIYRSERITNFIAEPLFHLYSKEDNKRLIKIYNGKQSRILELESKKVVSQTTFATTVFDEGNFIFYMEGKGPFIKIRNYLSSLFNNVMKLIPLVGKMKVFLLLVMAF